MDDNTNNNNNNNKIIPLIDPKNLKWVVLEQIIRINNAGVQLLCSGNVVSAVQEFRLGLLIVTMFALVNQQQQQQQQQQQSTTITTTTHTPLQQQQQQQSSQQRRRHDNNSIVFPTVMIASSLPCFCSDDIAYTHARPLYIPTNLINMNEHLQQQEQEQQDSLLSSSSVIQQQQQQQSNNNNIEDDTILLICSSLIVFNLALCHHVTGQISGRDEQYKVAIELYEQSIRVLHCCSNLGAATSTAMYPLLQCLNWNNLASILYTHQCEYRCTGYCMDGLLLSVLVLGTKGLSDHLSDTEIKGIISNLRYLKLPVAAHAA